MLAILGGIMALGLGFLTFTVTPAGPLSSPPGGTRDFVATWTIDEEIPGVVAQLQFIRETGGVETVVYQLPGPIAGNTATRTLTFADLGTYHVYCRIYPISGSNFDSENIVTVSCIRSEPVELESRTKDVGMRSRTGEVRLRPRTGTIGVSAKTATIQLPVK